MTDTFKFDGNDYDENQLSDKAKECISLLKFSQRRITELNNTKSLLLRAKNSYIKELKKEVLSNKAGLLFDAE